MVDKVDDASLEDKDINLVNDKENEIDSVNIDANNDSSDAKGPDIASSSVNISSQNIKLEDELKKSFIDYAMSVIVDRALPDVRDGLKPVHRRVLYDMYDLGIGSSSQTKKSARVVGDVIGRFHPHGDAAVYDTIVRMAQWFSMRSPLIFGQGNFGNIDGDGPAAMRYTEIKMTKIAEMMLQDMDKETVDTYANYDGNEQIPEVLPTRFPNLLVNGSSGIAVGMATNIPPHNLGEVIDGSIAMLDNPNITLDELMQIIKGPDFPTGGYIVGNQGIKEAYATGKGRCIMRARTHTEEDKSGRKTIYVDEIPYMVSKSSIVKQIADLIREKKIDGISEVNDLSDKDNLVRIAIDLKRDAHEQIVLNNLFEKTSLQSSFSMNMIALVNNRPKQLSLNEILSEFVSFRREVVTRRTVYLLRKDRNKAFLNEGLIVAKSNINKIVDMITNSQNADDAKQKLMAEAWDGSLISSLIERSEDGSNICLPDGVAVNAGLHDNHYYLSEEQASAILALRLQRLTHLATEEIQDDYKALILNIKEYLNILNNRSHMNEVIREELISVKNDFADKRRSDFIEDMSKRSKADFITKQDVVITLSSEGYIKYQEIGAYALLKNRGGKGNIAAKLKDEDYVTKILVANTHDTLLCFTSLGRVFTTFVYELDTNENNKTWRGRPIQNYFDIAENERITALLPISKFEDDHFVFMATKLGLVKKIRLSDYKNFVKKSRNNAMLAAKLQEGDELIDVAISTGDDDIFIFTNNNMVTRFSEYYNVASNTDENDADIEEIEDTDTNDENVSENNDTFNNNESNDGVIYSNKGVRPSGRSSGFVKGIKLKNGALAVSCLVVQKKDVETAQAIIATSSGYAKRFLLNDLSRKGRATQGVNCMRAFEKKGLIVGVSLVDDNCEVMLITDKGQLARMPVSNFDIRSRTSGGVIAMKPYEGESVIALQVINEDVVNATKKMLENRAIDKQEQDNLEQMLSGDRNPDEKSDILNDEKALDDVVLGDEISNE